MDFLKNVNKIPYMCHQNVYKEIMKFTLYLYSELDTSRDGIDKIINSIHNFIADLFIPFLQQQMKDELGRRNASPELAGLVHVILNENKYVFKAFLTEYNRFKIYENESVYVEPIKFDLKRPCASVNEDEIECSKKNCDTAIHIPLKRTLGIFLQLPGIFETISKYVNALALETEVISNIIQGRVWRSKHQNIDKVVWPLLVFVDGWEAGNALGSHAGEQKFDAVYVSLPCLPPHLASKLQNIFVSTIFKSKHRVTYGNRAVFQKVIDDVNLLSKDGIRVTVNGQEQVVYFECAMLTGDNLGLNGACGFTESFNNTHCCRDCRAGPDDWKTMCVEDVSLLRNRENYEIDLRNHTNGVKEDCIFREMWNFDMFDNSCFDLMHNYNEGVARDDIEKILTSIVCVDKIISLDDLNTIIDQFEYGRLESPNKPRLLTLRKCTDQEEKIFGTKKMIRVKQSAAEMLCLSRYLIIMIGDLIPTAYKPWILYKLLRRILGISTAPRFRAVNADILTDLIEQHNELYVRLYGDLKPKGHFGVHLTRIMRNSGPPIHYWSMKFERKHTVLKKIATNTSSSINLPYTIGVRCQLQLCYMYETFTGCDLYIKLGQTDLKDASSEVRKIFPNLRGSIVATRHKTVDVDGKTLAHGSVIVTGIDGAFGEPEFGKLKQIYKIGDRIIFTMSKLHNVSFESDYHAYRVIDNDEPDTSIDLRDIYELLPCVYVKKDNDWYVAMRYDI
ncbi:hypothetical protein QAD02_011735 [Eretmocerus hayati]|uniref:Uncharacterized protein n=1 Tax=Eretmocerus hayati TaxID=131215 RepID=A0ACC2P0A1_9HYME|nr:hypothetical protein QAD02_011735 [Eretmocerus hayati]